MASPDDQPRSDDGRWTSSATPPEVSLGTREWSLPRGVSGTLTAQVTVRRGIFRRRDEQVDVPVPVILNLQWVAEGSGLYDVSRDELIIDGQACRPTGLSASAPDEEVLAWVSRDLNLDFGAKTPAAVAAEVAKLVKKEAKHLIVVGPDLYAGASHVPARKNAPVSS